MYQESQFLPKQLVLFTLLLLGVYGVLLLRSELRARNTNPDLIAATLKSNLVADYAWGEQARMAFAPLSFALVEAKIRDENPYLSEAEVNVLLETVVAAAYGPIIAATPTPSLRQAAVIQSALVITESGSDINPAPSNMLGAIIPEVPSALADSTALTSTQPVSLPPALALAALPTVAAPAPVATVDDTPSREQPTQVATTPMEIATAAPLVLGPTLSAAATNTPHTTLATLPAIASTTSTFVAPTASPAATGVSAIAQPLATWMPPATATPPPSATATTAATEAAVSSAPVATVAAPTMTGTALSFVPMTATPTPTVPVMPVATNTPPPTATLLPTVTPTITTLPTATASPTLTLVPTPFVIAPPPAVLNVKARVENDQVYLEWTPILSAGLVGYNIYRSHTEPVELGTLVNHELLVGTSYVDTIMRDGSQSFYVVTAVNQLQQESLPSIAVTVNTSDLIAPSKPANFSVQSLGNVVQITWRANQESDLAGYNIYRSNHLPVDRTLGPLNGSTLLTVAAYQDTIIQNGQTYYYVFTAVDLAGNESLPSIEAQIPTINWGAP